MTAFDDWRKNEIAPASFYKLGHQRRDGTTVLMGGKTASAAEVVKTPLPGIRLITVKFEIGGHHAAETPQPLQPFLPVGFLCRIECRPDARDTDIDVIAFFQIEGFDNYRG
jgi:hypothetical protein